jgi:exopolysaccharide production protein ExoQ
LAIHTSALVSLPQKLAGGVLPGLGFVWAGGAILCLIFAGLNLRQTLRAALHAWPILLLTMWAWASYFWTVAPYETLRASLFLTCGHLFAIAVGTRYSWEKLIELFAITLVFLVTLSVALALVLPSVGRMQDIHVGAWSGVWSDKQLFGIFSGHTLIASLAMVARGPKYALWWLGAAISFLAIIGSTGKTALLMSFMAVGAGLWLLVINKGAVWALVAGWVGLVFGAIAVAGVTGSLDFILHALGRSSDFTGRTEVWLAAERLGDMRPMQGWGYAAIWRGENEMTSPYQWVMDWTDFKPANAHSSWLDVYVQLGLPGIFLLGLTIAWLWAGVLFRPSQNPIGSAFVGANLMAISFISFTETNMLGSMDLLWLMIPLFGTKLYASYQKSNKLLPKKQFTGSLEESTFTIHR